MIKDTELFPDHLPPEPSDEDKAKDIYVHLEEYMRGDIPSFRRYFLEDSPDKIHENFKKFLPEPHYIEEDIKGFLFVDTMLWQSTQHYDGGGVCGYLYVATELGAEPDLR